MYCKSYNTQLELDAASAVRNVSLYLCLYLLPHSKRKPHLWDPVERWEAYQWIAISAPGMVQHISFRELKSLIPSHLTEIILQNHVHSVISWQISDLTLRKELNAEQTVWYHGKCWCSYVEGLNMFHYSCLISFTLTSNLLPVRPRLDLHLIHIINRH